MKLKNVAVVAAALALAVGMTACGGSASSTTASSAAASSEVVKKLDKISVQYFDVETAELKLAEMYVTGYKAKLRKDTSYKGLWTVSFTLKEM